MSRVDPPSATSTLLIRIVAVMVLFLSVTACGLQVLGAIAQVQHPDPNSTVAEPALFAPSILSLIVGIALATILEGLARLMAAGVTAGVVAGVVAGLDPPADGNARQVNLIMAIAELQNSLPTLIAEAVQNAVTQLQLPQQPTTNPNLDQNLERMVKLLEEMKELSMLDENQRQNRRKQTILRRKHSRLEEVSALVEQNQWTQADALMQLLESLHPGDGEVQACRTRLDDARILRQNADWEQLTQQTTDLLALSRYTEATDAVNVFLERYPANVDAQQLSRQIRQEQLIHIETTAARLYDQIKTTVETRQWRSALDGIQDFLTRFPDNSRADKIRRQIHVIQKNAEIEERHEQENRMKRMIATGNFREAAEVAEDLLARFPDSPQAGYLADLLPKLREKSAGAEASAIRS